ncbi:CENP-B homolog protein 2-like [Rhizophagus irregularis DAOM 181602=DAOM 197198]|nr:CENP-B homolog protein 2-like [Rhizophagus irregularis DAOM 181602=DAOM 197198]
MILKVPPISKTRVQYADWVEEKWGVRVDETTITRILQTKEKRLITEVIHPEQKRHKPVTFPELDLAFKEFVLNYQHRTILSDAILVEKAKLLANGLGVPENMLQFSFGWLQGFKKRNGIRQEKLQEEVASANETAIMEALPLLRNKCAPYPLERIYNMDETGLFYRKERLSIALCSNADGSHKLPPLIIGKYANPRCFKNVNIYNLPMTYQNNAKAWMLITIFQEWLREFDR